VVRTDKALRIRSSATVARSRGRTSAGLEVRRSRAANVLGPERSDHLSRLRYRIDTVFSQLMERYCIKRVWARDLWHLAGRLLRKILSHTVAFLLNHRAGKRPLQLSQLLD
jgi:hypothetical protein